jgi:C4-dicarboxylate-specific signal transduction histidine kinase
MNLISNSLDAVSKLDEKWISIAAENMNGRIVLRFSDSGVGITDHVVDNMMRPFFTTKEVGKGAGLGLSVSKGIIENHGGRFFYEMFEGRTSFVIDLPMCRQNRIAAA